MDQIVVLPPTGCIDFGGNVYRLCLPARNPCDATPENGNVKDEDSLWNCLVCQPETKYNQPYFSGDLIQIQTLFFDGFNGDATQPAAGFGSFIVATIVGPNGEEITGPIVRSMVAYGCGRSYQIIEIDTSQIGFCPWNVRFEVFNAGGGLRSTLYSEPYEEVDPGCGWPMLTIKGEENSVDCFGHCYKAPDAFTGDLIEYDNTIRLYASIKHLGGTFTKSGRNGSTFKSIDLSETFSLQLSKKIPPYVHTMLLRQYLSADTVVINGVDYNIDSVNIQNQIRTGRMFMYSVTLTQDCENADC